MGAIKCEVFTRLCLAGSCKLYPHQECKRQSIFFFSPVTAAGDEIGWDFLSRVLTSRVSFSSYCNEMSRFYQTNNILAAKFMSSNTFIKWFYSWLAAFQIDFRKEVDPWCGYNPKVIACDGTHIGVSAKFQKLDSPITKPDLPDVIVPIHKRYVTNMVVIDIDIAWMDLVMLSNLKK